MMHKKGTIRDIFLIVILGFGMVLAGLFAIKVLNVINDKFQSSSLVPTEAKTTFNTVNDRLPKWVDGAFLLFWILLIIVGLFLALQVQTNPIFFPISIFYFITLVFVSRLFASIWTQMSTNATLSSSATSLTIIGYMMPKLPLFSFILGVLIIGIMVVKR